MLLCRRRTEREGQFSCFCKEETLVAVMMDPSCCDNPNTLFQIFILFISYRFFRKKSFLKNVLVQAHYFSVNTGEFATR